MAIRAGSTMADHAKASSSLPKIHLSNTVMKIAKTKMIPSMDNKIMRLPVNV